MSKILSLTLSDLLLKTTGKLSLVHGTHKQFLLQYFIALKIKTSKCIKSKLRISMNLKRIK